MNAVSAVAAVLSLRLWRRVVYKYIQLYSPHNMVAQANKTSKNTTNEIEKKDNSSTLHI